jgi:poly-gamma-glutamate system protein
MSSNKRVKLSTHKSVLILIVALTIISLSEYSKTVAEDPLLKYKIDAATLMKYGMEVIKEERLKLGIALDRQDDPNETGLIGAEFNDLTSSLGSLASKRTSTNPNFAGIIIEMFHKAGAHPGDPVTASFSGSFPALNIAVLSAIKALNLQPVILSSLGASTYGANYPQLTWLDMERILKEYKQLTYTSKGASLGGIVDTKGGLGGTGIEMGLEAIHRNRIRYLDEQGIKTLKDDIEKRLQIYEEGLKGKKPAAFINVGGALTSFGDCPEAFALSTGLLTKVPVSNDPRRGIIFRMHEKGVPVIHLLNIKKIATHYGLPVDPIPLPAIPSGRVMEAKQYSRAFALGEMLFLCLVLVAIRSEKLDKVFKFKRKSRQPSG